MATPTKIHFFSDFNILIFNLCSIIDLSNSFSHIAPVQHFDPVLVIIFRFPSHKMYALLLSILSGHSLNLNLLSKYTLPNEFKVFIKLFSEFSVGINPNFIFLFFFHYN